MKKERRCKICHSSYGDIYLCDTCGDNLITKHLGIPITVFFGYCSPLDGSEYHFCDFTCLLDFVIKENNKENPRNDIITGGKK